MPSVSILRAINVRADGFEGEVSTTVEARATAQGQALQQHFSGEATSEVFIGLDNINGQGYFYFASGTVTTVNELATGGSGKKSIFKTISPEVPISFAFDATKTTSGDAEAVVEISTDVDGGDSTERHVTGSASTAVNVLPDASGSPFVILDGAASSEVLTYVFAGGLRTDGVEDPNDPSLIVRRRRDGGSPSDFELRVYDPTNQIYLGSLTTAYDISFSEKINSLGSGTFTISTDSPQISLVQPRRVVRFRIMGHDVFAMIIDNRPRTVLDASEDPEMKVSGPSIAGWLGSSKGGALVYPEVWRRGGSKSQPLTQLRTDYSDRHFGWASPEYDDWFWSSPNSRGRVAEPELEMPTLEGKPENWTDGAAEWLWTVPLIDVYETGDVVGLARFRRVIYSDFVGPARIYIAAQNNWKLYFDGEEVSTGSGFNSVKTINVDIPNTYDGPAGDLKTVSSLPNEPSDDDRNKVFKSGLYYYIWNRLDEKWQYLRSPSKKIVVAVEAENTAGYGLFILSMRALNQNNQPGNVIFRTFTRDNYTNWSGEPWRSIGPDNGTPGSGWITNPNYDAGWWSYPASRGRQDTPMAVMPALRELPAWPDDLAEWLWSEPLQREAGRYSDPAGTSYFRRLLTGYMGPARIYIAGTNTWELYFDGQQIGSGGGFRNIRSFDVNFHHGEPVVIAVAVSKEDHPEWKRDPGQFVLNISRIDERGNREGTIYRTYTPQVFGSAGSTQWKTYGYPYATPGLTPGQIMRVLIEEAKWRGGLQGLTYTFNDTHDSMGQPWDDMNLVNRNFKIGTKLSYVLQQLAEMGIDWRVRPDGRLDMFTELSFDQPAEFDRLVEHSESGTGMAASVLLTRTERGFREDSEASPAGRMEEYVEFGDFEDEKAIERIRTRLLKRISQEQNKIDVTVSDAEQLPFRYLLIGDRLPQFPEGRISEITMARENDSGVVDWSFSVYPDVE